MSGEQGQRGTRGSSLLWAQGLVCGGLAAARPALALFLVVLFWPVAVAFFMDRAPNRPLARSVGLWAGAAGFASVRAAWSGPGLDPMVRILSDPESLCLVWAAAGVGWVLSQASPVLAETVTQALMARRAARLKADRAALLEEWRISEEEPAPSL
jgi:hypothetical protein